jgi:hypothetical protein
MKKSRSALAVALATGLSWSLGVQAETFTLGALSSPTQLPYRNLVQSGPFEDSFTFSISPGSTFEFTTSLNASVGNRDLIPDIQASLYKGTRLIEAGVPTTVWVPVNSQGNAGPPQVFLTPTGGGLGAARPWGRSESLGMRIINLDGLRIDPGEYRLHITGTATSPYANFGVYEGWFTLTPAVPDTRTLHLMMASLAALGLVLRRRWTDQ